MLLHFIYKAKYEIFGLFLGSFSKCDWFKNNWTHLGECQNTVLSSNWALVIYSGAAQLSLRRPFCFQESAPAMLLPRLCTAVIIMHISSVSGDVQNQDGEFSNFFSSYFFPKWIAFWPGLISFRAPSCAYMTAIILFPKEYTWKKSAEDRIKEWLLTSSSSSPFHYLRGAGHSSVS